MSFWTDFETAIKAEASKVLAQVEALAVKLKPLAIATAEDVATIALGAVMQQAPLVISGTEKLAAATASVINTLATQGKSVAVANAQAAVQVTYNALSALIPAKTN